MRKIMLLVLVCTAPAYGQNAATDFRTAAGCGPQKMQYEVTLNPPDKGVIFHSNWTRESTTSARTGNPF